MHFSYYIGKTKFEKIINLKDGRIFYQNEKLDVTIIEIKRKDDLHIDSFLELDNSIYTSNPQLLNKEVYLLHHPKGQDHIFYSQGTIQWIFDNNKFFLADYDTEYGSSGCPIIDLKNNLVIGIHEGIFKKSLSKKGIILKFAIEDFIKIKNEEIKMAINSNPFSYNDIMDMIDLIPVDKYKLFLNILEIINHGIKYKIENNLDEKFSLLNSSEEEKVNKEVKIKLIEIEPIIYMSDMFKRCEELNKVIATKTDMIRVTNMKSMFERCSNLEEISDISYWNLENVESSVGLFYLCKKLKDIPGIKKWNPIKLKSCSEMFFGCCFSLNKEQISQVLEWKNVDEKIKKEYNDGFDVKDEIDYGLYCIMEKTKKRPKIFLKLYKIFNK